MGMTPWDARLSMLAKEAGVRPPHLYHCLHAIAADPAAFSPQTYATFARLDLKHVEAMIAALRSSGLMPEPKRRGSHVQTKATRLPIAMQLPDDWLSFAQTERQWEPPTIEGEFQQFLDYWHAKAGRDALKTDWLATWRNWCRRSHTPQGTWQPIVISTDDQRARIAAHAEFLRKVGRE